MSSYSSNLYLYILSFDPPSRPGTNYSFIDEKMEAQNKEIICQRFSDSQINISPLTFLSSEELRCVSNICDINLMGSLFRTPLIGHFLIFSILILCLYLFFPPKLWLKNTFSRELSVSTA